MSSFINVNGSSLGTNLQQLLMADDIVPGSEPSYQLCKTIYEWHPMGAKIVEQPVRVAQSKPRQIAVTRGPESKLREAFENEWKRLDADVCIRQVSFLKRIYGIASIAYLIDGVSNSKPIDPWDLYKQELYFNVFDPLNTAGSLILNQNPNAINFLKNISGIAVMGEKYHPSRSCVAMNEAPVYLSYTSSAFGFVGRSVYQRGLFPLKSFVQSMITDDMVTRKSGLIVAKIKQAGSIVSNMMQKATGIKRSLLQEAATDQVISIGTEEEIASLNMENIDKSMVTARKNVIENLATACGMPAKLLLQESFAEGFGEGTEDAKHVVQYINDMRAEMQPLYDYFTTICQYRAWNPEFYAAIQEEYADEYGSREYKDAFLEWRDSFKATWPSLLEEPESELVKVDKEKLSGLKEIGDTLLPVLDPENKALLVEWMQDNLNEMKERMFKHALSLDIEALAAYEPPEIELQRDGQEFEQQQANKPGLKVAK